MQTVSIPEAKQVIRHIAFEMRMPLLIWGQPGGGKSEVVHQVSDEHDAIFCDVRLSQYDSVDLRGIPHVDPAQRITCWNMPATLPFVGNPMFPTDRLITLFLDEIGTASPAVQAPAYQLINDRRIGEHVLLDNVVIVAASNREGDKGVTHRMATPLANRFVHIELGLSVDALCEHAIVHNWPAEFVAFIQFRKPLISTFDPSKPDKSFATPRSWEKAMRCYASTTIPTHVKQIAMAGAVGDGPAAEFWGFVDVWQSLPNMATIEANPHSVAIPDEASVRYALTVAVSGAMTVKSVAPFSLFLSRLDPEFAVLAWQLAVKRDEQLFTTTQFVEFSKKFKAVFTR